jgi:hypothetical protein
MHYLLSRNPSRFEDRERQTRQVSIFLALWRQTIKWKYAKKKKKLRERLMTKKATRKNADKCGRKR